MSEWCVFYCLIEILNCALAVYLLRANVDLRERFYGFKKSLILSWMLDIQITS